MLLLTYTVCNDLHCYCIAIVCIACVLVYVYCIYLCRPVFIIIIRAARVILLSVMSICVFVYLSVCLFVNTITPEPLEISSHNFQASIYGQKGRQV